MKRIRTLRGLRVALTGRCSTSRSDLTYEIESRGGKVSGVSARVTEDTDLLVRGASPLWKHGSFGKKEARAAELIRSGSTLAIILAEDLDRLLEGHTVTEFPYVAGFEVNDLRSDSALERLGPLDAAAIVNRRLEQARLRRLHFGEHRIVPCSLCGRRLPTSLLVVGHIKRRGQCSPAEKRDLANVAMPICLIGCDELFERGFVAVSSKGRIVKTRHSRRSRDLSRLLARLHGRRCPAHTERSEQYFSWHREYVFQTGAA
jgi:hypothetical protein